MKPDLSKSKPFILVAVTCLAMAVFAGCSSGETIAVPTVEEAKAEAAAEEGSLFDMEDDPSQTIEPKVAEYYPESDEEGGEDTQIVEIIVTPSPTPKPTPIPTPEPTPSLPEVKSMDATKGYTTKSGVNMRAKPTTDSEILDTLEKAVKLTITGEAEEWYRVKVDDEVGYISSKFVGQGSVPAVLTIEDVDRHNGAVNASSVNMRKEPSTKGELIEKLNIFTHFTITGQNDEWYRIEYKEQEGYVSRQYSESSQGYYSSEELYLAAQLVHQEAKNTSLEGKIAVANVIYNRMRSSKFPDTIEKVVFQDGQFSPAENESSLRRVRPNSNAVKAVLEVFVRGETILPSSVLYFRSARMGTSWSGARSYYGTYGGNCFYK